MENRVLITGASSGIGREMAVLMAKRGYDLLLTARSKGKLEELKYSLEERYNIEADILVKDLSKPNAAAEIYEYTGSRGLNIHTLINNAGFGDYGCFHKRDLQKLSDMIRVNILSLVELTHLYLKDMVERDRGKIMNVASMAAFQAGPMMAVYYASKAFVLSFSEALSVELKDTKIKVSALCPGPVKTGFGEAAEFRRSWILKNMKGASAEHIAEYAVNALYGRKVILIPGYLNKLVIAVSKLLPRCLTARLVYLLQK